MKTLARIAGAIWMALVVVAGVAVIAAGHMRGNRAEFYALFAVLLPGIGLYRWGKRPAARVPSEPKVSKRPRAPVDYAAEAGHVMTLQNDEMPQQKSDDIAAILPGTKTPTRPPRSE